MNERTNERTNEHKPLNSLICWVGGKRLLRKQIVSMMPPHHCYVEPFGGAGWVLFYKEPSRVEVYNDINGRLVNLFRCVKFHPEEMKNELMYLFGSREQFYEMKDQHGLTDIQRAARFFYLIKTSFGGKAEHFGTQAKSGGGAQSSKIGFRARIAEISERLDQTIIENKSFRDLIPAYDTNETLFYCDPPYMTGCDYSFAGVKFRKEDHENLAEILWAVKGKWLLSYDDSPEVRRLYKGYRIKSVERTNGINRKVIRNGTFKEVLIRNY